jgi:hypothetical protein
MCNPPTSDDDFDNNAVTLEDRIPDYAIIDQALQHDLPVVVSVDGSLDKDGIATTSISILAPDIRDDDEIGSTQWQSCLAKILLIRSWWLPKQWGATRACINMAETLGFILGEYTKPTHLPILYITDSNNARSLQRRVKCKQDFTHRQLVCTVKQSIDHSIANHLDFLTSRWPSEDQLSEHTKKLYARGEEICKTWSSLPMHPQERQNEEEATQSSCYDSVEDISKGNRSHFEDTMFDALERILIVKVFSHQLNKDFTPKNTEAPPSPNYALYLPTSIVTMLLPKPGRLLTTYQITTT